MHPIVQEIVAKKAVEKYKERESLLYRSGIPEEIGNELSEEDWKILHDSVDNGSESPVATVITAIAYLTYFCGFILGLCLYYVSESFTYALMGCIIGLIDGTLMLGFATVIKLLQRIASK